MQGLPTSTRRCSLPMLLGTQGNTKRHFFYGPGINNSMSLCTKSLNSPKPRRSNSVSKRLIRLTTRGFTEDDRKARRTIASERFGNGGLRQSDGQGTQKTLLARTLVLGIGEITPIGRPSGQNDLHGCESWTTLRGRRADALAEQRCLPFSRK